MSKRFKNLSAAQIILLGFAAVILLGSLLLTLPLASANGHGSNFFDALFTATSAVCVTGLVVQDTATYWSAFGQGVILCLIQIGGMGVVTVAAAVAIASGRRISLRHRSTLQEALSAPKVGGIVKLTGFILKMTLCIELCGALLLAPGFCRSFGMRRGLWYAVFHSISAFCNAGFDLMGSQAPFSSLTGFAADPAVNLVIMSLIIIGGIGFLTWEDVVVYKWRINRYRMQSKVILCTTLLLLLIPALYFVFFEFVGEPLSRRIWLSLFQSVTPRTAGFNTADLTMLSETGLGLTILLMLVGGSPGSTAGGMKTTTVAVMISTACSVFKRKAHTNFFGRRIDDQTVRTAATVLTMYLVLFLLGGAIISRTEGLPLLTCLFETASAIGTVGLSLGVTPTLGAVSRWILILLMYCGRVGGLTLVFAAVSSKHASSILPMEKITVG